MLSSLDVRMGYLRYKTVCRNVVLKSQGVQYDHNIADMVQRRLGNLESGNSDHR